SFLGKRKAGERDAGAAFCHLDLHGGRIGGRHFGGTQNGVLREYFVVDLSHEIILAVGVLTPDLSELYGFHGHWVFLGFLSRVSVAGGGVNHWVGSGS